MNRGESMSNEFVCPILAKHIGQVVSLRGIVTFVSSNKIGVKTAVWVCEACGNRSKVKNEVPYGPPSKPKSCDAALNRECEGKASFVFDEFTSKYIDYQNLIINLGLDKYSLGDNGDDKIEIVLSPIHTQVKVADMVEIEASIRAKESKKFGHTVVPYGFTDNITITGSYESGHSIYHHSVILPGSTGLPKEKNQD